ncbi:hypothetical protein AJ80_05800 [Polytolypa hystricis UAMH7299]|uniref:Dicer-like protein 2 n=1 Tax=Polytolypa hystricis (strain UAMH7299) TaxID=1447883 RepID=A0A2B7XZV7_POLH7|nr:hypothetical protein AJ80_05800 [Polytolypa hystricis UAMH7299]
MSSSSSLPAVERRSPKRQKTGVDSRYLSRNEDGRNENGAGVLEPMLKPRAYQEEMLAESLRQNIIIAMDTGSGKTQIAILRIREELARCPKHKLVWFTVPTVALAQQQYDVISKQLPAFQTRMLSGADDLDHWSTQKIWDDILHNIRIVVSTPQVLLDALEHGFVTLKRIALLVFDEGELDEPRNTTVPLRIVWLTSIPPAHHCQRSAPANRIMQQHYHEHLQRFGFTEDLPHILGLTASPVTKSKDLETIEKNLNAVCKTPKRYREEMLRFVHRPELCRVVVQGNTHEYSLTVKGLSKVPDGLDLNADPLVKRYKNRTDPKSSMKLSKAITTGKTPCSSQLRTFANRAQVIHDELGPWAADAFAAKCIDRHASKHRNNYDSYMSDWNMDDAKYISGALSKVPVASADHAWNSEPGLISEKVEKLIDLLQAESSPDFTGIIFAQQRATVLMLARLLSLHPSTRDKFRIGPFVGGSDNRTSNIYELNDLRSQKDTTDDLRTGKKNLVIATSVLEEGIDVSACHLVVCFDRLTNLRSFIQRRGRARKQGSKFVIFMDETDQESLKKWTEMEKVMKDMYADEMRDLAHIQEREAIEEFSNASFRIESTEALLNFDNARPYLEHFCDTLSCDFTDSRPDFIVYEDETGMFSAKVILPNVLDPRLREFHSSSAWLTEKMAQRDAAFQAYLKLHEAGMVNENLLPVHTRREDRSTEDMEKRSSFACTNPWYRIATLWQDAASLHQSIIEVTSGSSAVLPQMRVVLPVAVPCEMSFKLFWNAETTYTVRLTPECRSSFPADLTALAVEATHILLSSVFSSRMDSDRRDYGCLFFPDACRTTESIQDWCDSVRGTIPAHDIEFYDSTRLQTVGLVRRLDKQTRPWVPEMCLWKSPELEDSYAANGEHDMQVEEPELLHVEGTVLPKRTDFLHPVMTSNSDSLPLAHTAKKCRPARDCSVDKLPSKYTRFAVFIPSIIHRLETLLLAEMLATSILAPVRFKNLKLIITAISASSAREDDNYQRIEFLGDSLLSLHTSLQLAATNPLWHEGLLSTAKDRVVSNARLSRAAIETGLNKFIVSKVFTGIKWRPSYNKDLIEQHDKDVPERDLSTKTLADVVEALVGAATIDGGKQKATECLRVFLPEVRWLPFAERVNLLYEIAPEIDESAPSDMLSDIEKLIGYTFTKKSLLVEAFTHPSSTGTTRSYQRLEFMGDAILDHIIAQVLYDAPRELPHYHMHLIRSALSNANYLAFLCLNTSMEELRGEIAAPSKVSNHNHRQKTEVRTTVTTQTIYLWQFMRHSAAWDIIDAQQQAFTQYIALRDDIHAALNYASTFPWALLSRLSAQKFFSDLIESLVAAIFLDSQGSVELCTAFLDRIGLSKTLNRLISEEGIDAMHPKERLGVEAGTLKVNYVTNPVNGGNGTGDEDEDEDEEGEAKARCFRCEVFIGGERIAESVGGRSKTEAHTLAAEAALEVFRGRKSLVDQAAVEQEEDMVDAVIDDVIVMA